MVGLDTSHVPAFANLLHDASHEYHVPGGRIVAAVPGGSPDFALSIDRVDKFTAELRDRHGVEIVATVAELRGKCDAIMLESIDGRVHLDQFREIADWQIPVFIDKPLAISSSDAAEILRIARQKQVRVTSSSAIRFAESFQTALLEEAAGPIIGGDFYGPMAFQNECPGYFWYGIHSAEMLFATMGADCKEVMAIRNEQHDIVIGRWADDRLGVLRGNREGNSRFGGTIHRKTGSTGFQIAPGSKPFYASLLERIIPYFQGQANVVELNEMHAVVGFLEAANHSATQGGWQKLPTEPSA